MRKRRTREEVVELLKRGEEAVKSGMSIKQFCLANNISVQGFYADRSRSKMISHGMPTSNHAPNNGHSGRSAIQDAITTLRAAGFRLPRRITEHVRVSAPKLKGKDLKKFKNWASWAWEKQQRFVVGWGGGVRNAHIVCHSMQGLAGRQEHAQKIRTMVAPQG